MIYCPECGSEVASQDVFCQYCGIALTPIVRTNEDTPPNIDNADVSVIKSVESAPLEIDQSVKKPTFEISVSDLTPETPVALKQDILSPPSPFDSSINRASLNIIGEKDTLDSKEIKPSLEELTNFEFEKPNDNLPINSTTENNQIQNLSDKEVKPNSNSTTGEIPFVESVQSDISFDNTIPYSSSDYLLSKLKSTDNQINEDTKRENQLDESVNKLDEIIQKPEEKLPDVLDKGSEFISLPPIEIVNDESVAYEQSEPDVLDLKEIPETLDAQNPIPVSSQIAEEPKNQTNPNIGTVGDTDGKSKIKLKPLDEGTLLNNRYEIVRKIGGGGMGAVYLASDKNLGGVNRAVKEMVQSYIEESQQEKAISDFKRESLLLTSLDHTGIPTIFDYFFDDKEGRFYLVMKYISGGDLAGRMRSAPEGKIDEITITEWAIQIADVLDYLHKHEPPIVYRDLKPSNIMLDGNSGKVMLIDFGIARWVNKEEKGVTAVGTMGYAPPELFSGNVEPRSDIYSLGSTMFHLLTGADPQTNPLLIFDFNKNPRPRQINSQLSDQIEQIIMRAVEYNSAQRFFSAAEMKEVLVKHLDNLKRGAVTFGVTVSQSGSSGTVNSPVFCGFCGQKILSSDMFCPFCGAQQPLASGSGATPAISAIQTAKNSCKLMIVGTNELENTEFNLEKENNLIGRRDPMSNIFPEVDLSKYDPQTKISRKHARIWRDKDSFLLEDLGSSNGTVIFSINNEPSRLLPRQPHILTNGDKIKVGDTTLRFTII